MSRYEGKPFLRMVDGYVLDAIGYLDQSARDSLAGLEPGVRESYGVTGSWREIVEQQMGFPAGMAGAIREVWESGRKKFLATNGHEPNPVEFAQMFVDTKFPR